MATLAELAAAAAANVNTTGSSAAPRQVDAEGLASDAKSGNRK